MQFFCCLWLAEHPLQLLLPEQALPLRSPMPPQPLVSSRACSASLLRVPLAAPQARSQVPHQAPVCRRGYDAARMGRVHPQALLRLLPPPAQALRSLLHPAQALLQLQPARPQVHFPARLPHLAVAGLRVQCPRCRCLPAHGSAVMRTLMVLRRAVQKTSCMRRVLSCAASFTGRPRAPSVCLATSPETVDAVRS